MTRIVRTLCYPQPVRIGWAGASCLAVPIRSYSEITWAPSRSRVAAISRLSSTTMAVVSEPDTQQHVTAEEAMPERANTSSVLLAAATPMFT